MAITCPKLKNTTEMLKIIFSDVIDKYCQILVDEKIILYLISVDR